MPERLSAQDSGALYFVKAFAILAAVAAHTSMIVEEPGVNQVITRLWDMISTISVGNFFIVGGILYQRSNGDSADFWKKKAKNMILPWIFCAVVTCTYRGLCGHPSNFLGYVQWILGIGSWYYYITVYVFLLAFFKPIYHNVPALWACVAVTAVSTWLRARHIEIPVDAWLQSDYLNPMYWVGFFALGILLRRNGLQLKKPVVIAAFLVFALSAAAVYRNWIYNYFHIINTIYSVSAFVVLLILGRCLARTKLLVPIRWIGSSTYCIYLTHMQIVQAISRRLPGTPLFELLKPVISVAVMLMLIEIGKWITRRIPHGDRLRGLVGLR